MVKIPKLVEYAEDETVTDRIWKRLLKLEKEVEILKEKIAECEVSE